MDDRPVLDQLNLVVADMARSVEFYRLLGVDIPDSPGGWNGHHRSASGDDGIDLDLDSTRFASVWDEGWPGGRPGVVIGFKLPDRQSVDDTYERMTAAGHRAQQPPFDAFWGARYAIVEDPDGNAIGLMSPIDPATRSPIEPPPD